MSVLYFSTARDGPAQGFQAIAQAAAWPDQLELCRSAGALAQRLHQPRGNLRIAVVNICSPAELTKVVSLKDLFANLATILILPDHDPKDMARAHQLGPRFLAYADTNPIVVAAVLAQMLRKHCRESLLKGVAEYKWSD